MKQLNLEADTNVFYIPIEDKKGVLIKEKVLICVNIPQHLLDEMVSENKQACNIQAIDKQSFIKTKFNLKHSHNYYVFDATTNIQAIEDYLEKEIDFEYYRATGVIEEAYPLNKGRNIKTI